MQQDLAAQRSVVFQLAERLAEARKLYKQGVALFEQDRYPDGGELIVDAARMGDSMAQDHLGYLYEQSFFGAPDFASAIEWYRKAADQQLANGQFHLGACYQLGNGVEQDYEQAARLFELAATQGHPEAKECLQMLLDMGVEPAPAPPARPAPSVVAAAPAVNPAPAKVKVVEPEAAAQKPKPVDEPTPVEEMPELPPELDDPSVSDAVEAYEALAMKNNGAAQFKLGLAYYKGRSVPANPKLACFWVMRALLAGTTSASPYLKYCTQRVPVGEHGKLQSAIFAWVPGQPVPKL